MRLSEHCDISGSVSFQSTHPVWGATVSGQSTGVSVTFQSTHPVWGATPRARNPNRDKAFQSTHPVWGATVADRHELHCNNISIHAPTPRVGCDGLLPLSPSAKSYFNPRTPCGVRRSLGRSLCRGGGFQSTHSVWVRRSWSSAPRHASYFNPRTPCGVRLCKRRGLPITYMISIHAPRVGCDPHIVFQRSTNQHFNPRTPCGVRL